MKGRSVRRTKPVSAMAVLQPRPQHAALFRGPSCTAVLRGIGVLGYDEVGFSQSWPLFSSFFMVLQTSVVCPVFASITVVRGRQLQVTVLAFSCLTTTQCSMSSAVGGGIWLRMGGGVAATGCFFAAQPARSRQNISPAFLMPFCFRSCAPACRWQSWLHTPTRGMGGRHPRGPAEITWRGPPVERARQASAPSAWQRIPPRVSGSHHCRRAQIRYSST